MQTKQSNAAARRNGIALIETISLITVIGVLLSLASIVLNQAYRVHAHGLVQLRRVQQLNFWSDRFREDVHLASEVLIDDGVFVDREGESDVRYTLENASIVRRTQSGEQTFSVERWDLPPVATADWEIETGGRFPLLSLRLVFRLTEEHLEPVTWVARIGTEPANLLPLQTTGAAQDRASTANESDRR